VYTEGELREMEKKGRRREGKEWGELGVCTRASALDPPLMLAPVYDVQY